MDRRLWQFLTNIDYDYPNSLRANRANFLLRVVQILIILTVFITVTISIGNVVGGESPFGLQIFFGIAAPFLGLILIGLLQYGFDNLAAFGLVGMLLIAGIASLTNGIESITGVAVLTPVLLSALILSERETLLIWLIMVFLILQSAITNTASDASGDIVLALGALLGTMSLLTFMVAYYTNQTELTTSRFEEDSYRIRRITQAISTLNIDTEERVIINRVMSIIQEVLNYTPVSFYLANDQRQLVQRVRSGQLTAGEAVELTASSALAEAARLREAVVVDLSSDSTRRRHFEAGTVSTAAIPIFYGEDVIGVLDVQTGTAGTLEHNDVLTLQALANLLYGSLRQSRAARTMQDDLRDQQQIIINQRERLRSLGERDKQLITQVWDEYLTGRRSEMLGFDIETYAEHFTISDEIPDEIRASLEAGEIVTLQVDDHQKISVPIAIRGQVVGAMSFRMPVRRIVNQRQLELLKNVVQRLGLALENKRLVEQSQSQAQRESRANEIGSLLLSTTDIESVLAMAAERFNEALGAIQTQIHLQPRALEDESAIAHPQDTRGN